MLAGHGRKRFWNLYVVPYGLSSFLDSREDFARGYFDAILVESEKEPDFQVNPRVNEASRKTLEPVKDYPIEVVDE